MSVGSGCRIGGDKRFSNEWVWENIDLCNCLVLLCGTICFFAGIFTFLVCFRFNSFLNLKKTKKKVKITTKNILSQMITQGGWIYKFIQFNLIEFFYENPRNMKGARWKMLLICLGTNKKLFTPEILRVKNAGKNSPKIE